jgi:four helix bundle protein
LEISESIMGSFHDLVAWQKAMALAEEIYSVTSAFPAEERFGLTSQMRRCAVSIACNIAEGHGRLTTRDFQHFLAQARGSALELETQLLLVSRLRFGSRAAVDDAISHVSEVQRLVNGLLKSTRDRPPRNPEF